MLTTPVIRCLREQTGAEVHFLTKAGFAATLAHNPYLHRLWTIQKDVGEVGAALAAERFTHLIDLHGNLRTLELKARLHWAAIKRGSRPPRTTTYIKLNWHKFLLTRWGIDRLPDVHIVDRYLAAARPLKVRNDGGGLDYFVAEKERIDLATRGLPRRYVALVIGAAHATKRLEESQLITLCSALPVPVILLGGPAERAEGERIAAAATGEVHNGCGAFSLAGSADLVRQAAVVVTHDTGLMHVAAAFHRPTVSVWGNTVPAFGMYPYLPAGVADLRAEVSGLACRPCSKIGYPTCPRGHFRCMRDQDLARIARDTLQLLSARP